MRKTKIRQPKIDIDPVDLLALDWIADLKGMHWQARTILATDFLCELLRRFPKQRRHDALYHVIEELTEVFPEEMHALSRSIINTAFLDAALDEAEPQGSA